MNELRSKNIDKTKTYYTRDNRPIDGNHVWELDKEGFVIASLKWELIDLSK